MSRLLRRRRGQAYVARHRPGSACCGPRLAVDPWQGAPMFPLHYAELYARPAP